MVTIYHKEEVNKLFDKTNELFEDNIQKEELKNHCLEVSVIMRFLAKELEIPYATLAVITNYAAGLQKEVTHEEVTILFNQRISALKNVMRILISN